jgi:hypothetical protein
MNLSRTFIKQQRPCIIKTNHLYIRNIKQADIKVIKPNPNAMIAKKVSFLRVEK